MREINFGLAEPDFSTPKNIVEQGNKATLEGKTRYSPVGGLLELLEATQKAFKRDSELDYNINQLIIGNGSTQLISNAIQSIIEISGKKEIILPAPYWRKYEGLIQATGAKPVISEMDEDRGFKIKSEKIKEAITPQTAGVIINNPCNPTGYIIPKQDLKKIGELAIDNNLYIIYDQIYSSIFFENKPNSIAAISNKIKSKTITIESCSKKYSMTGYRIGYCGALENVINKMKNIQENTIGWLNMPAQYAAIEALNSKKSQEEVKERVQEFKKRRDYMHRRLDELNLKHTIPKGTFSFFVKVPESYEKSQDFVDYIDREANIKINPGTSFGKEGYARFTFCCSLDDIKEGMDRIKNLKSI